MIYYIDEPGDIYTQDGSKLEIVTDFKYLGSHTESTEAGIKTRIGSAWKVCNKLKKNMEVFIKQGFQDTAVVDRAFKIQQ